MKKTLIGAVAALLTLAAAPAMAQDFTGPRIGVTGGFDKQAGAEGFNFGGVVGIDAPVVKGVTLGAELTLEDSTLDQGKAAANFDLGANARLGVKLLDRVQAFGKVGYARTNFHAAGTGLNFRAEGVRFGGGLEYALTKNLYTTVEYRRTEYGNNVAGRDSVIGGVGIRF